MKNSLIIVALVMVFLFSVSSASASWWNATWQYRNNISIDNILNLETLRNYTVSVNITYDSNMTDDFSSIRFTWYNTTADSETELPFWIENKTDSSWAYVWTKVKYISPSATTTVYVYYGNVTPVTSGNNGNQTFILFDDFEDGDTVGWGNTAGCTVEPIKDNAWHGIYSLNISFNGNTKTCWMSQAINLKQYAWHGVIKNYATASDDLGYGGICTNAACTTIKSVIWNIWHYVYLLTDEGVWTDVVGTPVDAWGQFNMTRNTTSFFNFTWNYSYVTRTNYQFDKNIPIGDYGFEFRNGIANGNITIDDIFIRNYSSPEPSTLMQSQEHSAITTLSNIYNATLYESDVGYYQTMINLSDVIDANATLMWNNTAMSNIVSESNTSTNWTFIINKITPYVNNDTNITYYWSIAYQKFGSAVIDSLSTNTTQQLVRFMKIDNCTMLPSKSNTLNMLLANEETFASMIGNMDATFIIWRTNSTMYRNYSFDVNNNNTLPLCLAHNDSYYNVNAQILYSAPGYSQRPYWLDTAYVNNVTQNATMYLLNTSVGSIVTMTVKDESNYPKADVYIMIQRYYPEINEYKTVTVSKSDSNGESINFLTLYTVYYRFLLQQGGVILQSISPMQLASTSITLPITPGETVEWFQYYNKIGYACSYLNTTNTTRCTVADTSGVVREFCLDVYKLNPINSSTMICRDCSTSAATTLACSYGDTEGNSYIYKLWADTNFNQSTTSIVFDMGRFDFGILPLAAVIGLEGVFLTFLLCGTTAFVGIWNPAVSIILMITGLVASFSFGLISFGQLPFMAIIDIALVGLVLIYRSYT